MAEKMFEELTHKRATRGKHVVLHKYWKGIAATILNKADRRHYMNMMLDATVTEITEKHKKRKDNNTNKGEPVDE